MRLTGPSTIVALLLAALPARAQLQAPDRAWPDAPALEYRLHVALDYQGPPGCSDGDHFENALRVRVLTWDIFAHNKPWPLKVRVWHYPGSRWFEGSSELREPNGKLWVHAIRGPYRCADVFADLAIKVAVDAMIIGDRGWVNKPAPPAPACPEAKPCPDVVCPACNDSRYSIWPREWPLPPLRPPEPDPPKPPERWPFAIRIGASVWPELVATGWGSLGVSAEIGARYRFASLSAELHGDPTLGTEPYPGVGSVSFSRVSGAAIFCAHWGWFAGCAVADVGRLLFPTPIHPLPSSAFYGAAGARAGLEFPVVPSRFFIRTALDVRAPLRPVSYSVAGASVFQTAGPGVGFGLGALVELPP